MTPDPHAEVLRGGAGAPWAALVPEQLRFLEPDVVHGSWELSKSRETHQAVPAGKQAEGGRRPRDEPAADGLHTAPGAHRAVSSIPAVLHPEVGSNRCYCVLGPRAAEEGGSGGPPAPLACARGDSPPAAGCPQGSAPGSQVPGSVDLDVPSPDAVARMAADRARLRSCCHPDLLLLGPQAKEGHDVPSRPDGPKQRPGSRERPRPRPPECCCRPPVRVWELARVTAPGTVAPAMAAGLLGLLRLSRWCCPTSEKGP
ncbi:histone-lysine N-methyltransferase 2D-like isoform X1 [Canis lupus familiaris]|uniref:histone-lysine N-methyltransferase 2D-like isoform X1 n=1 Tax=Canis lupus familiaris TaxID=9615 RepID=UPI000BAA0FB3|nr:histone-lysine N-methyltransferase 2D-like isoform X1 [Canis lupus familiaris]|eukprot:XP_022266114.1 histone-lysine N-methyltransferase 2D-like isoform X1 [Canis lupus familiaris]